MAAGNISISININTNVYLFWLAKIVAGVLLFLGMERERSFKTALHFCFVKLTCGQAVSYHNVGRLIVKMENAKDD